MPGAAAPPSGADLPLEVVTAVFRQLDHDSLFCALQACTAWRAAGDAPGADEQLWQHLCRRMGTAGPGQPQLQMQQPGQGQPQPQQHGQGQPQPQQPGQQPEQLGQQQQTWRQRYRQQYGRCCYDCLRPTQRHTLAAGSLRVLLCHTCSDSHASPQPWHRLVASAAAKRRYCLRDSELPARHCVEPNPVNPAFTPMHLFRRAMPHRACRWRTWPRRRRAQDVPLRRCPCMQEAGLASRRGVQMGQLGGGRGRAPQADRPQLTSRVVPLSQHRNEHHRGQEDQSTGGCWPGAQQASGGTCAAQKGSHCHFGQQLHRG